ncbi:MAG TPA: outer membrane protein assembly factor BamD [Bacteroidales bacterium]|nr:outer membrane protein assembly factor BamD [Bacteroidales bacterium]
MKQLLRILILSVLVLSSCGEYDKLLKSTDYELKMTRAKEYFNKGQYVKSSELLSQVIPMYRGSSDAEELAYMFAMCFYRMNDYFTAGSYFKEFIEQFPFGVHAEEGFYLAAYCDYKQSPRPELDQATTLSAIDGLNLFIDHFPSSEKVPEAKILIKELEEKLVEKSYTSARLYYDMQKYKASITALENGLKTHANTKYREEMLFLKLNSLFKYAELSLPSKQTERYQDTLDEYYSFMEEYPKSSFSKQVSDIFEKTNNYLKGKNIADGNKESK